MPRRECFNQKSDGLAPVSVMLHPSRDSDNAMVSGHHLPPGDYRHLWDEMNELSDYKTWQGSKLLRSFNLTFLKRSKLNFTSIVPTRFWNLASLVSAPRVFNLIAGLRPEPGACFIVSFAKILHKSSSCIFWPERVKSCIDRLIPFLTQARKARISRDNYTVRDDPTFLCSSLIWLEIF